MVNIIDDSSFCGSFSHDIEQYNIIIRNVEIYSFESLAFIKVLKKNIAKKIYKIQYSIEG